MVFRDGYVLNTIDSYFADGKNNDGDITQHISRLNSNPTAWLQEGFACVVERGFRDVIDACEDLALKQGCLHF